MYCTCPLYILHVSARVIFFIFSIVLDKNSKKTAKILRLAFSSPLESRLTGGSNPNRVILTLIGNIRWMRPLHVRPSRKSEPFLFVIG